MIENLNDFISLIVLLAFIGYLIYLIYAITSKKYVHKIQKMEQDYYQDFDNDDDSKDFY